MPSTIKQCNTMQNHVMPCKNRAKRVGKPCKKLPSHTCTDPEDARPTKKNWARKKRMASWARQRQQITEAADGGARARTGHEGPEERELPAALRGGRAAERL